MKEGKDFSEESIRLEHKVAKSIHKQQEVGFFFDIRKATELMAYEAFYSYPVNDAMSITPAVYYLEGSTDQTGIVVKTSFSF